MKDKLNDYIESVSNMNRDVYLSYYKRLSVIGWLNFGIGILMFVLWIIELFTEGFSALRKTYWIAPIMLGSMLFLTAEKIKVIRRIKVGDD